MKYYALLTREAIFGSSLNLQKKKKKRKTRPRDTAYTVCKVKNLICYIEEKTTAEMYESSEFCGVMAFLVKFDSLCTKV